MTWLLFYNNYNDISPIEQCMSVGLPEKSGGLVNETLYTQRTFKIIDLKNSASQKIQTPHPRKKETQCTKLVTHIYQTQLTNYAN